jgi:hypothetical protein
VALIGVLAIVLWAAPGARALAPPSPWDGSNPYNCTLQDAGFKATGPDPGADPYCVQFDKTQQNVTQLGLVSFLLEEPARVAAAVPKCFYFQADHWRGSVIQSDGRTVLYEFIGHYFFNKATGDGGAWVTGFSLGGQTFDPTMLPGFPPQYGQYFGPGTGGMITHDSVPVDPQCVALAQQHPGGVYAQPDRAPRCAPGGGAITRRGVGPVALGARDATVQGELGPPGAVRRGFLRYCVTGGGELLLGEPGDRSGTFGPPGPQPVVIALTSSPGFTLSGQHRRRLHAGAPARALHRAFPHARLLARLHGERLLRLARGLLAVTGHRRILLLGSYVPRAVSRRHALAGYVRRAG